MLSVDKVGPVVLRSYAAPYDDEQAACEPLNNDSTINAARRSMAS